MEQPEDPDLIEQTLAGEQRAFAALVERYGRDVYVRIARMVRYPEDVEDLVQDVFVKAYTRLGQLKDRNQFPAWLRTIADNVARTWYRRRMVQLRLEEHLETEWADERRVSEDKAMVRRLRATIRDAIRTLSEAHRQVIVHHYFKGYSYLETAELLELEVDTVRSRLQKARRRLRKEVLSMNDQPIQSQTFELTREDLNALRWAAAYVSRDKNRPVLQGVCFDTGRRMVATDGHRLFFWTSENLNRIAVPVLLGPWLETEIPDADRATLSIGVEKAILRIPGEKDRMIPVMEGPYAKYEKVIPATWAIRATVAAGALIEAADLIADHLVPRHPVAPEGRWQYLAQVEIRLAIPDQTLSLITTRDMGYFRETPDGKRELCRPSQKDAEENPPGGASDWTFVTSIQAQVESDGTEEVFRISVDHTYLRDAIRGLETERDEALEVRFIDPLKVILFTPVHHPNRKTLLMPMRMTPD